jgi:hypothetical protein
MLSDHDDTYGVMPGSSDFQRILSATDERLRRALERDKARRAEAASTAEPNCGDRLHDRAVTQVRPPELKVRVTHAEVGRLRYAMSKPSAPLYVYK